MATTQYIGSRYVPILADPVEWSSQKTYEPLTIVTHGGNSYTSRQFVPVGIDISNEEFWAMTGNYNAQIELYRQDVANLNDEVEEFRAEALDLAKKFTNVRDMKQNENLVKGDICITGGYDTLNDGGGSIYYINDAQDQSFNSIECDNGLYAVNIDTNVTTKKLGVTNSNVGVLQDIISYYKTVVIDTALTIVDTLIINNNTNITIDGVTVNARGCDCFKISGNQSIIKGINGAVIYGDGYHVGILIGGPAKTANCNYNVIEGVDIRNHSIGVHIYNDQQNGLAAYFNKIINLNIFNCNSGITLEGYANAEIIDNIVFTACGDANTGGAIVCKNVGDQRPLDNVISNIFHHASLNATTLRIERLNHSIVTNIVSEQGGISAKEIVITDDATSSNIFINIANVAAYRTISNTVLANNIFIDHSTASFRSAIIRNALTVSGGGVLHKQTNMFGPIGELDGCKKFYVATGLTEDSIVPLFSFLTTGRGQPRVYKVRGVIGTSVNVATMRDYFEAVVLVRTSTTQVLVTIPNNVGRTLSVNDTNNAITVRMPNNGTGSSAGRIEMSVEEIVPPNTNGTYYQSYTIGESFTEVEDL